MTDDLAPLLSTLPEPVAPSSITATVMARIEREAAAQRSEAGAPAHVYRKQDVSTWVTACIGLALICGAVAFGWYSHGIPNLFAPQLLRGGLKVTLVGWQAMLVGFVGIVLCLHALFAPLRARQR